MGSYYEVLGTPADASQEEIDKAYREKIKRHHPDSGNAEASTETAKEINKAYEVLEDKESREAYDRMGHKAYVQAKQKTDGDYSEEPDPSEKKRRQQQTENQTQHRWSEAQEEKIYDTGWILASQKNEVGEKRWMVCTERGADFINEKGEMQKPPSFFKSRETAEQCYGRYLDKNQEQSRSTTKPTVEEKLGNGWVLISQPFEMDGTLTKWAIIKENGGKTQYIYDGGIRYEERWYPAQDDALNAYRQYTNQQTDTREQEWSQIYVEDHLDRDWSIAYQDNLKRNARRWIVFAEVNGGTRYITNSGKQTVEPFWFGSKKAAVNAYKYAHQQNKPQQNTQQTSQKKPDSKRSKKCTLCGRKVDLKSKSEICQQCSHRLDKVAQEQEKSLDKIIGEAIEYTTIAGFYIMLSLLISTQAITELNLPDQYLLVIFPTVIAIGGLLSKTTSLREIFDFVFAGVAMFLVIWFGVNQTFGRIVFPSGGSISVASLGLIVSISFIVHEFGHKSVGLSVGEVSEFRAFYSANIITVIVAYVSGIIFLLPGGVHSDYLTKRADGITAAAGPAANILLSMLFILTAVAWSETIGSVGYFINMYIAGFNLLPIPPLDGSYIAKWNSWVLAALIMLPVGTLVGAALIFLDFI